MQGNNSARKATKWPRSLTALRRRIAEFRKLNRDRYYLLTWFGEVLRLPGDDSQFGIEVLMVPLREGIQPGERIDLSKDLIPADLVTIPIAVGVLSALHIGQVYRNGHCIGAPEFAREVFERISMPPGKYVSRDRKGGPVFPDSWTFVTDRGRVPRRDSPGTKDPLIPYETYPLSPPDGQGGNGIGANCLSVPIPGRNQRLLIPCAELARFYYSPSTEFAQAVFNGFPRSGSPNPGPLGHCPRPLSEFYDDGRSHIRNGWAVLYLQNATDAVIGPQLARFCFSDYARWAALQIHQSIIKTAHGPGQKGVPLVQPPFDTETDLTVHGIWLGSQDGAGRARYFLVLWIERCTARFPFERYFGLVPASPEVEPDGFPPPDDVPPHVRKRPPRDDGSGDLEQTGQPSARHHRQREVHSHTGFAALEGMPTRTRRVPRRRTGPGRRVTVDPSSGEVQGVATGEGTWEEDAPFDPFGILVGGKMSDEDNKPPKRNESEEHEEKTQPAFEVDFGHFQAALEEMKADERLEVGIRRVRAFGDPDVGSGASLLPRPPQKGRRHWLYISNEAEQRRHVLIAEVRIGDRYAYLFEVERRPMTAEAFATFVITEAGRGARATDLDLEMVLQRCGDFKGVWRAIPDSELREYTRLRVQHCRRPRDKDGETSYASMLAQRLVATLMVPTETSASRG